MRFPVAKLLDYEAQWETLERSTNPFAVFVMAHLKTLATMRKPESRLEWKLRLSRALFDHNYDVAQIQQLLDFIDWLMVLDDSREARFDTTIRKYEEEKTVPTVSRFEQRWVARGKQEGALEMLHENVLDILNLRFGSVPSEIAETVQKIDDSNFLKSLLASAVQITSLDDFRRLL